MTNRLHIQEFSEEVAQVVRECGNNNLRPLSVTDWSEVEDGEVNFDGWHLQVGDCYVIKNQEIYNRQRLVGVKQEAHQSFDPGSAGSICRAVRKVLGIVDASVSNN